MPFFLKQSFCGDHWNPSVPPSAFAIGNVIVLNDCYSTFHEIRQLRIVWFTIFMAAVVTLPFLYLTIGYPPYRKIVFMSLLTWKRALSGIRTHGLPFRRGTLYPAELWGHTLPILTLVTILLKPCTMVLGCLTRIELARSKEHQGHNLTRLTSIRLRHSASGGYRTHFPRIGTGFTDRLPDLRRTDIVVYSVIALLYQTLFYNWAS